MNEKQPRSFLPSENNCRWLFDHLPAVYLIVALFAIIISSNITPAFQVPDETNHFLRAEQVSRGVLVPSFQYLQENHSHRYSADHRIIYPDSGSYIGATSIHELDSLYSDIKFHPENKVSTSQDREAKKIRWDLALSPIDFPNTAIYAPTGYLFSAMGIFIGKWTHMSVLDTLVFSRIINGICNALICFFALQFVTRCRLLLFFILLLPLPLSLFASVSQDAVIISLAALLTGLIENFESRRSQNESRFAVCLTMIIVIMTIARPPYALLMLIVPLLSVRSKTKLQMALLFILFTGVWFLLSAKNYGIQFASADMRVNAPLQSKYILEHPLHFAVLFFHVSGVALLEKIQEFIGILGWIDLRLPAYYYTISYILFFLVCIWSAGAGRLKISLRLAITGIVLLVFVAIMTAQYITWMPLEIDFLGGVQSRYFIPLMLILSPAIAGFRDINIKTIPRRIVFMLVMFFPLFSQIIVIHQIIVRYYLK